MKNAGSGVIDTWRPIAGLRSLKIQSLIENVGSWVTWFALAALFGTIALLVRTQDWYTSGSAFGYNLGLAGGLLMLALLIYPLKKRMRLLQRIGPIKPWFIFHMVCGVLGPLLIIFHSTFRIGSQNAMVAMISMLLVAGSGIVGRFIYVRIHDGLSGHELKLDKLEGDEESEKLSFNRDMHWAPDVIAMLMNFRDHAKQQKPGLFGEAIRFLSLPWRERRVRHLCHRALSGHLDKRALDRQWDAPKRIRRGQQFDSLVARYTSTVKRAAQYNTYKRLFAWWHILHLPFVYLLAASAVYHVIAVHMY
ncbi:MAG: hypothetical protein ABI790_00860 [Betaproteobacteria bacterium]